MKPQEETVRKVALVFSKDILEETKKRIEDGASRPIKFGISLVHSSRRLDLSLRTDLSTMRASLARIGCLDPYKKIDYDVASKIVLLLEEANCSAKRQGRAVIVEPFWVDPLHPGDPRVYEPEPSDLYTDSAHLIENR